MDVQLLGKFRLMHVGSPLTTFKTPRLQALLAFLVLNPSEPQFRYQIAYSFWPESSEGQARTNLRNLIHLLRQALPQCDEYISFEAQTLQWRQAAPYTLDVNEFERWIARASDAVASRENLERAVNLYQGDLLPSCYDTWIVMPRERLRQAYLAALEGLVELAGSSRDYCAAIGYARRLVQTEPLHTAGNHQLIRLLALTDDRPAAVKAYQAYAGLLERELGLQPDRETQELYAYLKRPAVREAGPPTRGAPPALVGRQAEWRKLQALWRSAVAGNPQAVFVVGEAGIGKTRLIEELTGVCSRLGIRASLASCYPAEGNLPYAPIVSWLRSRPIPPLDPIWVTELSRLMPELQRRHSKPAPLTEAWQRLRLFEALARAILANRTKQLLVMEDIHWCDQDSLDWLHYLLRFDPQAPTLLVATERSEEIIAPDHPVKTLKTMLANLGQFTEIDLGPLSKAESFELAARVAQALTRPSLSPEAAQSIYTQTEGNPLFIVEAVRLGQPLQAASETLPSSGRAQSVLKRRISQLTPATRELASLAATIGREFRLEVLRQASTASEADVVRALGELIQRRVVQEIGPDGYDFTHEKLREAVFAGLSTAHRCLLHRQVAEAYLRLDRDAPRPRQAEIASHYELAGLPRLAVPYYRQAAELAAQIFANAEALRYLKRAIDLAESLGVGEPGGLPAADYAELLERVGDLLSLSGQFPEAQAAFERALAQPLATARIWRSRVYRKISEALVQQYDHPRAHTALDQAEQTLGYQPGAGSSLERQEWIRIQFARGMVFYWDSQPDQMDEVVRQVAPAVEAEAGLDQRLELLRIQSLATLCRERYRLSAGTVELTRRRLELAEALADPYRLAVAQFEYGFNLLWHGDTHSAREMLTTGFESAARLGARLLELRCLDYLAIVSRRQKDTEVLRQQAQKLVEMAAAMGEHGYHGVGLACQGWLAWQAGDLPGAEKLCQAAVEIWEQFAPSYAFRSLATWVLLATAVSRQDLRKAAQLAQSLLDPNPRLQPILEPMAGLLSAGLTAWARREASAAYPLFRQALEAAQAAGEL